MNKFWAKPYEKRLEPAFHNLTHIDLRFEDIFKDDDLDMDEEDDRHRALGRALKSAKNLKSLSLHFGDTDEDMQENGDTPQIVMLEKLASGSPLDKTIWPKLEFLELHGVGASFEDWTSFITAHSATLRTLCLSSLQLTYKEDEDEETDEDEDSTLLSWSRLLNELREVLHGKHVEFRGVFTTEDDYGFDGDFNTDHDARWFAMDRKISTGPDKEERFGKLVEKWFVDSLGTEDNPITKYGHLFKDDEGYDEDEYGDGSDDEDFYDHHWHGPMPHPFHTGGPLNPHALLQHTNPHSFMQHLMSSIHGTPLTPQMVMQHLMETAAMDAHEHDEDSMPDLINADGTTANVAHEDDADSMPDLISVDGPTANDAAEDDSDSMPDLI